jgi:phage-related protein
MKGSSRNGPELWENAPILVHSMSANITPVLDVRFFSTESGNEPVREWLSQLPKSARREIGTDIKTAQFGWPLGMPIVRKIEPGLWEIRTDLGDCIARVIFTIVGKTMVLLHGFIKKTQKLTAHDLKIAKQRQARIQVKS